MNIYKNLKIISWAIIFLFIFFCKKEKQEKVITKNEYYIVIDTSGSMAAGPFLQIQKNFNDLLSLIKKDDALYLISFNSKPQILKKIDGYSPEQQEELQNLIQTLKPHGLHTDFYALLNFLQELTKQSKDEIIEDEENIIKIQKKQFIIILTDGKDDPEEKRKLLNLKDYEVKEELPVKDKYVYYISFADRKSEELQKGLETISPNVKTIERPIEHSKEQQKVDNQDSLNKSETTNQDSSGIQELKQDIIEKQKEKKDSFYNTSFLEKFFYLIKNNALVVALILLILLLLIFLFFWKFKPKPLKGELIYYQVGDHPSMGRTVKLSRFEKKKLTIGNDPVCLIKIKEFDFPKKIDLIAVDKSDGFNFRVPRKFLKDIQIISNKESKSNVIYPGDKFKIKNYIFEYSYGNKYKNQ